jgi:pimeloyl-ACP methyl ester carboxylesterase
VPTDSAGVPAGTGIDVDDTVLWVEDTGERDLPVVLCLHSLFLDGRMFDAFVEAAAGRYRVIRPDFRGQGRSAPATTPLVDMDTCAADMAALVEKLDLRDVNLLMQSMGGDVGFRLLARAPDRFRAAVVLGSSACAEPPEQLERFRKWVDDACSGGFVGETLDMTMEIMFGETTRKDPAKQETLAKWRDRMAALPGSLRPAMSGVIERGSALDLLPGIRIPILVFSGAEDLPRPPAWADEMAAGLPNAKLVRLQKIGHSPILEAPDLVIPQILAFFDDPNVSS